MKKHNITLIFCICLAVLLCGPLIGRDIPRLPDDPNITKSVLPNGISYYIAKNVTEKGLVEFALVQKLSPDINREEIRLDARRTLDTIPRIYPQGARKFMVRNGLYASKNIPVIYSGIVNLRDDAVVYRFGTQHSSRGRAAMDSTLLMIFGIIEKNMVPIESNAIIISGDIDRNDIQNRLQMLSLIIPGKPAPSVEQKEERLKTADSTVCAVTIDSLARYSSVRVVYSTPRPPRELMGTVLPLVSGRLGDIMGRILKKRLQDELKAKGVPAGRIDYKYCRSTEQSGDERYEIAVYTDERNTDNVARILAGVLSGMSGGVPVDEFIDARGEYQMDLYETSLRSVTSNGEYVDMCISSFLYGSDLSTKQEKFRFFAKGKMDDAVEAKMFNRFVEGLIDSIGNARIAVRTGNAGLREEDIWQTFCMGWTDSTIVCKEYSASRCDTLQLPSSNVKVKIKSAKIDPVSGGTVWKFDNGVNVVYKKMPTGGLMYYKMIIRGGYSAMKDIKHGEGAFLSDMLHTYNIAGMTPRRFNNMLLANGIEMDGTVSLSDMAIFGVAPRKSMSLAMKSMVAIANNRAIDQESFDYYRECEKIRLEARRGMLLDRLASIDSLMCPSYNYSSFKTSAAIYPDLQDRANTFFEEQFSRVNDGVIVIVGDMDETVIKKFLQNYVAMFQTQTGNIAGRLTYQPVSGGSTKIVKGRRAGVDVVLSAPVKFNAESYMAAKILELAVQDILAEALCGTGVSIRAVANLSMYPQERLNMTISVEEVPTERFPSSEAHESVLTLLSRIREGLNVLCKTGISSGKMAVYRKMTVDDIASWQNNPEYWISAITMRYVYGKDLNTKYSDKVNAVTAAKVQEMVQALNGGSKVEYVVRY